MPVPARALRCLIPALALVVTPLLAQDVSGAVVGRVVDTTLQPVRDVQVTITGLALQGERRLQTNQDGYFRALDLPPGSYTLRFALIGFRPVVFASARVHLGTTTEIGDVRLAALAVELSAIEVTSVHPAIDPVSTTVGSVLEARQVDLLPIGRDYATMVTILPHANESYFGDRVAIGGSTGLENAFFVDGVNVTDPHLGSGGARLPHNFIRSVEVRNGGYEAEYGQALGGVVNAITYSGGNRFEGNVFAFYSGSAMAGESRGGLNDPRVDRFSSMDIGARLGGPIAQDRVWFSLAYNPRIERSYREIPGFGLYQDRFDLQMFAGKVTWLVAPETRAEVSVFGDPSTHHLIGPPPGATVSGTLLTPAPFLNFQQEGGVTGALRLWQQVGSNVAVEARLSRSSVPSSARPDTSVFEASFVDTLGQRSGGPGIRTDVTSHRTSASLVATGFFGPHTPKLGIQYEDNRVEFTLRADGIAQAPTFYRRETSGTAGTHHNRTPDVFLQDSWQAGRRLTVNAGLRWSSQQLVGEGDVGVRFPDQWQPRVGFVYQPGTIGSQRVFGSYGRFYQQLPLYFSALWYAPFSDSVNYYSKDPRVPGVMPDSTSDFSTDLSSVPKASGVKAEQLDEFTLGYERVIAEDITLQARVIYRRLRAGFGYALDFTRSFPAVIGNFGEGDLSFLPEPRRDHTALELTLARVGGHRLSGQVSYVLSRTYGNYTGLFSSDQGWAGPGQNLELILAEQSANSTGLLPNDRTHVLKVFGSYRFDAGLTVGAFGTIQSGTPLNEFGASAVGPATPVFLVQRGSAGRTDALWDANLRVTYTVPWRLPDVEGRVILDVLHLGNPRRPLLLEQVHFLNQDANGGQISPNPTFGQVLAYQPPMAARIAFQLDF